jgi:hypothetical protein
MRVENAAKRTGAQADRDKALGMLPGAPDLEVLFHSFSFYIEMKTADGRVSEVQERVHAELRARGQCVLVGWGAERTIAVLDRIEQMAGLPLRDLIMEASIK